MEKLQFTIPEIFSFIGVTQCLYIIVYMLFRADKLNNAGVPFLYFFTLGAAFFLDFSWRFLNEISPYYEIWGFVLWFAGPPLSVLVIMQMVKSGRESLRHYYWVLCLPAFAFIGAYCLAFISADCRAEDMIVECGDFKIWLVLCNILTGGASLLVLWFKKDLFRHVRSQKYGRERYWLILTILINNIFFLALMFSYFNTDITDGDITRIRTLLGLVFIYLITTSLFRVYPQSLFKDAAGVSILTESDQALADKITGLLEYEKIYHESGYSRSDLARELGVSEFQASNVINAHFGKSLPQLLNEYRIEDAQRLLVETAADIKVIAEETGFNSIATFNRVFREMTGHTPSAYRKNFVKK